jgi:hypothetical protein
VALSKEVIRTNIISRPDDLAAMGIVPPGDLRDISWIHDPTGIIDVFTNLRMEQYKGMVRYKTEVLDRLQRNGCQIIMDGHRVNKRMQSILMRMELDASASIRRGMDTVVMPAAIDTVFELQQRERLGSMTESDKKQLAMWKIKEAAGGLGTRLSDAQIRDLAHYHIDVPTKIQHLIDLTRGPDQTYMRELWRNHDRTAYLSADSATLKRHIVLMVLYKVLGVDSILKSPQLTPKHIVTNCERALDWLKRYEPELVEIGKCAAKYHNRKFISSVIYNYCGIQLAGLKTIEWDFERNCVWFLSLQGTVDSPEVRNAIRLCTK